MSRYLPTRLLLGVIAILVLSAQKSRADLTFFPGDPDAQPVVYHDKDKGPNGTLYVYDGTGINPCFYSKEIPAGKTVLAQKLVRPYSDGSGSPGVWYLNGEKKLADFASTDFDKHCPSPAPPTGHLSKKAGMMAPAAPAATPVPINISNDADVFDTTCEGHFAVVGGANSATPVSLVNLDTRAEISTFAFNGFSQSVAVCDDGQSVLVHLDNNSSNAGQIRRLTINAGALSDTMQTLPLGSASVFIKKVYAAPGSKTGIALLQGGASQVVSFTIPGLTMVDSVSLAVSIPNGAAFNCTGTKVYFRSGNRGISPDVIECFGYNPTTGVFTKPASLTINGVGAYTSVVYPEPLGLTLNAAYIVASEANPTAGAPTPRVTLFDATTGARANAIMSATPVNPINVDLVDCCSQRKRITTITRMGNGHIMLQGKVESPNWTFSLQLAPNMSSTFANPISLTSDSNGMFQYDDAGTVGLTERFYRLTYP